jgi:hypothetical protein
MSFKDGATALNINKIPWCVEPFVQMSHTASGNYRVCCIGRGDDNKGSNTKNMTPEEYWNSDEHVQIRNDMFKPVSEFSDVTRFTCEYCIKNNRDDVYSRRERFNASTLNSKQAKHNIQKHLNGEKFTYKDLKYVNFKILGNICNLKCIMCGPWSSSRIASELKKYNAFGHDWPADQKILLEPFTKNTKDYYYKELEKIIDSVSEFVLVGGETLIHPDFNKVFSMFINSPNVKNMKLNITTNGTVVPQIILDNAHLFKQMMIAISVDGIGSRGSYVRSGLDWERFDINVRKFSASPHVELKINPSIQMLNIGYIEEMLEWVGSVRSDLTYGKHINWGNIVTRPEYFRAIHLPDEIKSLYIKKLYKKPVIQHWLSNKALKGVHDILKQPQHSHNEFLKGIQYLKTLDSVRNTNLLEHFPEFEPYYI